MTARTASRYVVIAALVMSVASLAQARRGGGGEKGLIHKRIMKELELSEEQREQIRALRSSEKEARQGKRELREGLQESMHQAIIDFDESEMRKAHTQLEEIRTTHSNSRFENLIKLLKILTPEQRQKYAELQGERRERRRGRRARGGDRERGSEE